MISIEKSLRKFEPANCSRTKRYLTPYFGDETSPKTPTPTVKLKDSITHRTSPRYISPRPPSMSPKDPGPSIRSARKLSSTPKPIHLVVSKSIQHRTPKPVETVHEFQPWDIGHNPSTTLLETFTNTSPMHPSDTDGKNIRSISPRRSSIKRREESTRSAPRRKASQQSNGNCARLSEFIAYCSRPSTVTDTTRKRTPPKLSVSFKELKECLEATDKGEKDENGLSRISETLKLIKRRKREEARNIMDGATLRLFRNQRREVSNYIITKFRRLRMWKHSGNIVPRKLEDSMYQYWTDVRS